MWRNAYISRRKERKIKIFKSSGRKCVVMFNAQIKRKVSKDSQFQVLRLCFVSFLFITNANKNKKGMLGVRV